MLSQSAKIGLKIFYRNRIFLACLFIFLIVGIVYIQYSNYFSNVYKDLSQHYHVDNEHLHDVHIHHPLNDKLVVQEPPKKSVVDEKATLIENVIGHNIKINPAAVPQQNIPQIVVNPIVIPNPGVQQQPPPGAVQSPQEDKKKKMLEILSKLERIVHIDLKGAPPKIDYFKDFIPLLKKFGATGILIEYEDMFPFKGQFEEVKHGHAYSEEDVKLILKLAKDNDLTVMPLVQTYGHLEWLLKHKKFAHLRENPEYPQVISPCIDQTYDVLFEMLDQVIALHPDVPYFHIGCDEVFYKLENEKCRTPTQKFNGDFTTAFMSHIVKISEYVRKKLPKAKIIIWDDMMHNMNEHTINQFKPSIEKFEIEPMIWAYMENVITWYQPGFFARFGKWFKNIWAASAYKGAGGELVTITSVQHHYLNHLTWNEQIYNQMTTNACHFRGIALTGWSRYDHFLQVCDLLPQAIPSLIYNLKTVQLGEITQESKTSIGKDLGCVQTIPWKPEEIYDGYITCTFPGHEVYEAILPIQGLFKNLEENMEFAKKYMSPISIKYNYAHKSRAKEVMARLEYTYSSMLRFKNNFIKACQKYYWEDTYHEWLEVYFMPEFDSLYEYMKAIRQAMKENHWLPRPLPVAVKDHPDFV